MFNRPYVAAMLSAALVLVPIAPAFAAGEILLTHAKALAGNVTPGDPPGFPIVLTQPGAYQFAGNIHPPANTVGIQVGSYNVTIDLNGFQLHGSTVALFGIAGATNGVTIKNGTITGFKFDGIHGAASYWIVDNVRSVENGRDGIMVGPIALIRSSVVAFNMARGISTGFASIIQGNTVVRNGTIGVQTQQSTVVGNTINNNDGVGLVGGGSAGYFGNTLNGNDVGGSNVEAEGVVPAHPNACAGACP
jgi:hypothetical protein